MILSNKNYNQPDLTLGGISSERVNTFKYPGVKFNAIGDNHREIQQKINAVY